MGVSKGPPIRLTVTPPLLLKGVPLNMSERLCRQGRRISELCELHEYEDSRSESAPAVSRSLHERAGREGGGTKRQRTETCFIDLESSPVRIVSAPLLTLASIERRESFGMMMAKAVATPLG